MRKFLQKLFGPKTPLPVATEPQSRRPSEWINPGDPRNPFAFRLLDVSDFATSTLSVTQNPAVAKSFGQLRTSDGSQHVGKIPQDARSIPCNFAYPMGAPLPNDGPIFRAAKMEEKWDLSLYQNRIYFSRSWTDALIFVAQIDVTSGLMRVINVVAAGDGPDDPFALLEVDFLLKSHLFGRTVPAPLPTSELPPDKLGLLLFGHFGSKALYAASADDLRPYLGG